MELKSTYNRIAEDWVKDHGKDTWWQPGTDFFLSYLPQSATILDVGCGGGLTTRYMADKGFKASGVDFSENMIEIARRDNPGLEFDVVDMYKLDEYQKTFDAVYAKASLLHIPKEKVPDVIHKMKDLLNLGGFLYIAVRKVREGGAEEEFKTENDYGYEYKRFFSYFSEEELRKYIKDLSMELVWEGSLFSGKSTWLQVIAKKI